MNVISGGVKNNEFIHTFYALDFAAYIFVCLINIIYYTRTSYTYAHYCCKINTTLRGVCSQMC